MKAALFAFNGEPMCFVHVLLNALDMKERGHEAVVVLEGLATKLAKELGEDETKPFAPIYKKVRDAGLICCACKACSVKTGALEGLEAQGVEFRDEMSGHPSIAAFEEEGYSVYTF